MEGNQVNSALTSWVYYIQLGFVGVVFFVGMFCGASSGG